MGIFLMVAISLERLYVLKRPLEIRQLSIKTTGLLVLLCALYALFWCVMPLFGWSHYSLEVAKTSCFVAWNEHSFAVVSYNVTMFLFVFIIPLLIIIVTNIRVVIVVRYLPEDAQRAFRLDRR